MKFRCQYCEMQVTVADVTAGEMVECGHCGKAVVCPEDFAAHFVIGDYTVLNKLGSGRLGGVYLAEQATLSRKVAIKVLYEEYRSSDVIMEFFREARIVARLNHPNIVQSYSVNEEEGHYFLVMEYVEGDSLRDMLDARGHVELSQLLDIMQQAVAALQYAWDREGLVHRNIKPENILLTKGGQTKLSDIGLISGRNRREHGLPFYRSPEELLEAKIDSRSDIYALGIVFFEALTGRLPINATEKSELIQAHFTQVPPLIHEVVPALPKDISQVVSKMLAKHPDDRYRDMDALESDLAILRRIHSATRGDVKNWDKAKRKLKLADPNRMQRKQKKRLQTAVNILLMGLTAIALIIIIVLSNQHKSPKIDASETQAYYTEKEFSKLRESVRSMHDRESKLRVLRHIDDYLKKYPKSPHLDEVSRWRADTSEILVRQLRRDEHRRQLLEKQQLQIKTPVAPPKEIKIVPKYVETKTVTKIPKQDKLRLFFLQKILGSRSFDLALTSLLELAPQYKAKQSWLQRSQQVINLAKAAHDELFDSGDKCAGSYVQIDQRMFKVHSVAREFIRIHQDESDDGDLMTVTLRSMNFRSLRNLLKSATPDATDNLDKTLALIFWNRNFPVLLEQELHASTSLRAFIYHEAQTLFALDFEAHLIEADNLLNQGERSGAIAQLYLLKRKYASSQMYKLNERRLADLQQRCSSGE